MGSDSQKTPAKATLAFVCFAPLTRLQQLIIHVHSSLDLSQLDALNQGRFRHFLNLELEGLRHQTLPTEVQRGI